MTANRVARPLGVIVSLLLAAALLGGCVEVAMESEYNEDGSARHAFEMTIDRGALDQLSDIGGEGTDTFDPEEGREEAEAAGFEFTPIDTDDKVGSRIAKTFDDGEDVQAAFNEMFTATADEDTPTPIDAVVGTFVKDGDEYRLNLTIDSDILFEGTEELEDGEDAGFSPESIFEVSYVATLPGEITETNGRELGDGKIEWELPLTGSTEISAVSETEGSGSTALLAIIGLVALLLVGGLLAGFLFTRRRPAVPTTAAPATDAQPATWATPATAPSAPSYGTPTMPAEPAPATAELDPPDERPTHEQDTKRLP